MGHAADEGCDADEGRDASVGHDTDDARGADKGRDADEGHDTDDARGADEGRDADEGQLACSAQVPVISTVWLMSVNPWSAAIFSAQRSTAGPSTSTVRPHTRHTR